MLFISKSKGHACTVRKVAAFLPRCTCPCTSLSVLQPFFDQTLYVLAAPGPVVLVVSDLLP